MADDSDGTDAGVLRSPPETAPNASAASDAFQALSGETRTAVVRTLAEEAPLSFSALFDASGEETSAGFAYHLRQLVGRFVRQRDDEQYELTDAGRAVARAMAAGTYTDSVDRDPFALNDDCPLCGASSLVAAVADNVAAVRCRDCETTLSRVALPPNAYAGHDSEELSDAVDARYRRRVGAAAEGRCPDCGGPVDGTIERVADEEAPAGDVGAEHHPIRAVFDCGTCATELRCPVALTALDRAAVVAFYHDHGRDIRDRPVWNVGSEWRERVVATDPWCVLVSTRLDDEELRLYVAGDATLVDHRRVDLGGEPAAAPESTTESESAGEDGTANDEAPA